MSPPVLLVDHAAVADRDEEDDERMIEKLSNWWVPIAVWVGLLVVLVVGLRLLQVNSTVQGGILGAYCGVAVVVVLTVRERAAAKLRNPMPERYR
jgi:hypothetical protein